MVISLKVSVLTITYNQEAHVENAIRSALHQAADFDIEIVVSDDCSTDNTGKILGKLASDYPGKINLLLRNKNVGSRLNLIETYLRCKGDYIARLDGDDYWTDQNKLNIQASHLDANNDLAICFHAVSRVDELNKIVNRHLGPEFLKERYTVKDIVFRNFLPSCSIMYRNNYFDFFPDWIYECPVGDWPLNILHALNGDIGYINRSMAAYRLHSESMWSSIQPITRLEKHKELLFLLLRYLDADLERLIRCSIAYRELQISGVHYSQSNYIGAMSHLMRSILRGNVTPSFLLTSLKQIYRARSLSDRPGSFISRGICNE